jgi:S1-C subfamily serine protease
MKMFKGLAALIAGYTLTLTTAAQVTRPSAGKTEHALDIPAAAKKVVSVLVEGVPGEPDVQGSGFFVDSHGTLVTNHHVVEKASSVAVKTSDGAYYLVEGVLADDAEHDLAVLKVKGRNFAFLPLGDSNKVRLGDRVIAIGSPLGLESTVSDGIVSGLREEGDSEVIQTTAPISPGSSGGVLLNSRGEVIGVTTFFNRDGQNLNFAIPANNIRPLLTQGSVRPFNPPLQKPLAEQHETPTPYGVPKPTKIEPSVPKAAPELGRQWVRVEDGTELYVRQIDDLLRFQGTFSRDAQTRVYFTLLAMP